MTRNGLRRLVMLMFAALALAFILVLLGGLGPNRWGSKEFGSAEYSSGDSSSNDLVAAFSDIAIGETNLRRYQSQRVWVSRLSDAQRQKLTNLKPFLLEPNSGCALQSSVCVLLAATPKQSFEISYSLAPPPQLPSDVPWHGGFVDPTTGVVYDLLGRVYHIADVNKWNSKGIDHQSPLALEVLEF